MTASALTHVQRGIPGRFHTAAEWMRELGDVPAERIIMDPLPGTATEADLLHYVERDTLCELVDGTLVEKPVGYIESLIAMRIAILLGNFVYPRRLGEISGGDGPLRMKTKRVRLPDVTFVSVDAFPGGRLPQEVIANLPPTLAVEVISKSNTRREMEQKLREYFDSGAKLVWFVYPEPRTVAVFDRPTEEPQRVLTTVDEIDGGSVLPGFSVQVAEFFASLPEQESQPNG
jgi:Uma2 family endonuclease